MSPISPDQIALTDAHRQELDRLTRAGRTEQRLVVRAGIVLLAADGYPNSEIAARLGVCEDTARKWRRRWCRSSRCVGCRRRRHAVPPVMVGGRNTSRPWIAMLSRSALPGPVCDDELGLVPVPGR
jgi:DNA-binding CsgD family transcriptional regulator